MGEPGEVRAQASRWAGEQGNDAESVACPFCGSTEAELFSLFSQFLLASQYYCRNCRTVFDRVRWGDEAQADSDNPEQPR